MTQVANGSDVKRKGDLPTDILHIFVLFSFALAQPVFDTLSRNAEFFIVRHSQPVDIILLVFILCVLFPALVVLIEVATGLFSQRGRKNLHGLVVATLVAGILLPALRQVEGVSGTALLVGAVLFGVAAAIGYMRFHAMRMFLTVLSPVLLVFPSLFLLNSPIFKVVFMENDSEAGISRVAATAPVVMVIFDAFPVTDLMDEHRHIDPIRYPNFAALAQDATWFRNATTVADSTGYAVPAILTGSYPDSSRLPTAGDYPHNIFTLLGGSYNLKVFGTITQLCPDQLCEREYEKFAKRIGSLLLDLSVVYLHILLPMDLSANLPSVTHNWMDFAGGTVRAKANTKDKTWFAQALDDLGKDRFRLFRKFVNAIDLAKQPTLYFLHILLPHDPYIYLPSGKTYTNIGLTGLVSDNMWGTDEWPVVQSYQRHLLQVGFVDSLLGKLLARLKEIGLYDRSLIVITADHGVSFHANGSRRPLTKTNFQDIMPVPLFIKAPNQHKGEISDQHVETIDILPTIADILGIRLPWSVDGNSAFDRSVSERSKKVVFAKAARERMVFNSVALVVDQDAAVKRKIALFSSGEPGGLFKIGPHKELLGRRVSKIGVVGEPSIMADLDQALLFANVNPEATFLPINITGYAFLDATTTGPLNLAIAVNGTIRAVTRTFGKDGSSARFSTLVPETTFRAGRNDVEVFVISAGTKGQPKLVQTKRPDVSYALFASRGQGSETIWSSKGPSIPVIPDALKGYLDAAIVKTDRIEFRGWTADVKRAQLPEAILIFVDGKFFHSGRNNSARPSIAKRYGSASLQGAGFNYLFPLELFRDLNNLEVRVFAISKENVASELTYPKGYKWGKKS